MTTTPGVATARPDVAASILELIGRTPLLRLNAIPGKNDAEILVKLESLNPAGSVKDRIALAMVEAAEADGRLQPGATIVEPTSGNTGIGLAMVCAVKRYRLVLTMPEDMSLERRRLFARYGAEVILTPAVEGMTGAVATAELLLEEHPDWFMPQQFQNPANPGIHYRTTAEEILAATDGRLDVFVAGVGTGGTITGVGRRLRECLPSVRIVAVEPSRSPVLSGGHARPHAIQGIGASFVPGVLDRTIYDEVVTVHDSDAIAMAGRLIAEEGILAGISSGANVWVARKLGARLGQGHRIVTFVCDTGERYLSVDP